MSLDFSQKYDAPIVTTSLTPQDHGEVSLRPEAAGRLYRAGKRPRATLPIQIEAARRRNAAARPMCCSTARRVSGKTTLAGVIANEMGAGIRVDLRPGDRKGRGSGCAADESRAGRYLFIDEIHRLNRAVEEILYPAMEDFAIDIIVGKGPSANSIRLDPARALPSSAQRPEPGSFPAPCATVSVCSCVWSCTPQKNCSALSCAWPRCWALRSSPPARGRSRPVRAGRRVSRTACCAACAISRRSATTA